MGSGGPPWAPGKLPEGREETSAGGLPFRVTKLSVLNSDPA